MVVDPAQIMGGASAAQGVSNTNTMAPPQAGGAMPMDPTMDPMAAMQAVPQEAPPKPPSLLPTDVGRVLASAINDAKMQAAIGLRKYLGDARGTVHVKDSDLLTIWRQRNPDVDPLYEKIMLGKSDEEVMEAMYPARRALIRFGRRTYTEQVVFAEKMARLDQDTRFDGMDDLDDDEEDTYIPPQAKFPSRGEETYREDTLRDREEARAEEEEDAAREPLEEE